MKVLDCEPYVFHLLEDGEALYLSAICSHSAFDYVVLIAMNPAEVAGYRKKGRGFLMKLAGDIQYSAPAARGSLSPFGPRNLTLGRGEEALRAEAAITAWDAAQA